MSGRAAIQLCQPPFRAPQASTIVSAIPMQSAYPPIGEWNLSGRTVSACAKPRNHQLRFNVGTIYEGKTKWIERYAEEPSRQMLEEGRLGEF